MADANSFPQSISTTTESLLSFSGIFYVKSCIRERRLNVKLHRKPGNRVGVAAQLAPSAWSALPMFFRLKNHQNAYWRYFIYDRRMASLHVLMSRRDVFSPRSQQKRLDGAEQPDTTREKVVEASPKRIWAEDCTMRLLTSQLFSHSHELFCRNNLYLSAKKSLCS